MGINYSAKPYLASFLYIMKAFIFKLLVLIPVAVFLAIAPFQVGFCDCAVEGAVCGDPPTWNPCCEPDQYECKKAAKEDAYGTCEKKKEK